MPVMIAKHISIVLAAMLLAGCGGKTYTFDVSVTNHTPQPITVWLTKDGGGPYEKHWRSPEDLAIDSPRGSRIAGVQIPPGLSAGTGKVKGKFDPGTAAMLRVYAGDYTFSDLLAVSRRSPNRAEIMLYPGVSRFSVTRDAKGSVVINPPEDWIPKERQPPQR
jgi:hypothetical protein